MPQTIYEFTLGKDVNTGKWIVPKDIAVYQGDYVRWKIPENQNVGFKIIGNNHPFKDLPTNHYWVLLGRNVKAAGPKEWKYTLQYNADSVFSFDPKITVKPNPNPSPGVNVALIVALSAVIVFLFIRNIYLNKKISGL